MIKNAVEMFGTVVGAVAVTAVLLLCERYGFPGQ